MNLDDGYRRVHYTAIFVYILLFLLFSIKKKDLTSEKAQIMLSCWKTAQMMSILLLDKTVPKKMVSTVVQNITESKIFTSLIQVIKYNYNMLWF